MKKNLILSCVFFFLLISSCTSTNKLSKSQEEEKAAMESWMGHSKAELIQSWGPPTKVTSDGQGGEILIYDKTIPFNQTPGTVYGNGYGGVNYTNPTNNVVTRSRMFYVNNQGKIYHWLAQGRLGY